MKAPASLPLQFNHRSEEEMIHRSQTFANEMFTRRSVRRFSKKAIPREVILNAVKTAGSAPSGANRQPWHFAVVSNMDVKRDIRQAAEEVERAFYAGKAPDRWLRALSPLGTGPEKPFLTDASHLITIFLQKFSRDDHDEIRQHYYMQESVGIAIGMLITALHHAGVGTLTYTPTPMRFLNRILQRPDSERAVMILVAGYPSVDATVPTIQRKEPDQFISWFW